MKYRYILIILLIFYDNCINNYARIEHIRTLGASMTIISNRIDKLALFVGIALLLNCCSNDENKDTNGAVVGEQPAANDNNNYPVLSMDSYTLPAGAFPEMKFTPDQIPLFVIIAGNKSCKEDDFTNTVSPYSVKMFQKFSKVAADFESEHHIKPDYMLTCYLGKTGGILMASSSAPNNIVRADESNLSSLIISQSGASNRPLIIIGHSYGGWAAIKAAFEISQQKSITGLFSLDPISALECTNPFSAHCHEAPIDITPDISSAVANSSLLWINFYQKLTFYLHSGVINNADENIKLFTDHHFVDTNDHVWQIIEDFTRRLYFR
jgi:hypothetical protein